MMGIGKPSAGELGSRKKWWARWIILTLFVVGGVLPSAFWLGRSEPRYEGKTLSQWLERALYWDGKQYRMDYPRDQKKAIQAIGTNGIPHLLDMLDCQDYPFTEWVLRNRQQNLSDCLVIKLGLAEPMMKRNRAVRGFSILGGTATNAVSGILAVRLNPFEEGIRVAAINAVGPQSFPMVTNGLTNARPEIRMASVISLRASCFETEQVIEPYLEMLRDPDTNIRLMTITCLGSPRFYESKPVITALTKIGRDENDSLATAAQRALEKINPVR